MTIENLILQLQSVLKPSDADFYSDDVKNILWFYRSSDWREYININDETYNKEVVFRNDIFEIIIITWGKNQGADVHDHADNGCWMKILDGSLEEKLYDKDLNILNTNILKKGAMGFMNNDKGYHSISNTNDGITVSLHIYNPPNHNTKYFKKLK
jgi:cysteine dioxygenase